MDAIDEYIKRLGDPKVRSFNNRLNHVDEREIRQTDRPRTLEEHVVAAEQALEVVLPPSYRKLVTSTDPADKEYGFYWVWVDGLDTYGDDIVSYSQSPDNTVPPFLIAVLGADDGNEYCFDTRHADERGEYPIVEFDPEMHNEDSTEFETAAKDLGEFLLKSSGGAASL